MAEFEARTQLHVPASDVHSYLLDLEEYGTYSEYLTDVTRQGSGTSGSKYSLTLEWRFLRWEVHAEVTANDPPHRIGFRVASGVTAHGEWVIEPDVPDDPTTEGCVVWFRVQYDPRSLSADSLDLPSFIPVEALVDQVAPHFEADIYRVIREMVGDLEGAPRDPDIHITSSATG